MKPLILHAPEIRRLLAQGDVLVVRPIKEQPNSGPRGEMVHLGGDAWGLLDGELSGEWRCPLGAVGEQRWVRETWRHWPLVDDTADKRDGLDFRATDDIEAGEIFSWRSPVTMPRCASRFTVRVEDVRVVLVQKLSEADAIATGIPADRAIDDLAQWARWLPIRYPQLGDNPWCWAARVGRC